MDHRTCSNCAHEEKYKHDLLDEQEPWSYCCSKYRFMVSYLDHDRNWFCKTWEPMVVLDISSPESHESPWTMSEMAKKTMDFAAMVQTNSKDELLKLFAADVYKSLREYRDLIEYLRVHGYNPGEPK